MQQLQRLALFVKIRVDHLRYRIGEWAWERKFNRAVKKYGGGANIPPEIVGELLGNTGDDYGSIFGVHLSRVCTHLNMEPVETETFNRICWMYNGSIPSIEDRIYTLSIVDELSEHPSEYAYALVLRELIHNKDTSYNKIREHFKTHAEYTEFMQLCGRE
ncbi:hypothetical protein D3C86_1639640 [compost metagenome]